LGSVSSSKRQGAASGNRRAWITVKDAALDQSPIAPPNGRDLTQHSHYRYPARFSPRFASAAVQLFTEPGDIVLDPFVGSGTTLVEALRHGRRAVGIDISPISVFVASMASHVHSPADLEYAQQWMIRRLHEIRFSEINIPLSNNFPTVHLDHARNWRILSVIDRLVQSSAKLPPRRRDLVRLTVLRSSQWAFDHKAVAPGLQDFLKHLQGTMSDNANAMLGFGGVIADEWGDSHRKGDRRVMVGDAAKVLRRWRRTTPTLADAIVTSPPYPGVHILYGRWQVDGRRETSLPLWIIGARNGLREGDYTMHARRDGDNRTYFELMENVMQEARECVKEDGWSVHMVGFSDPIRQLPIYLRTMRRCGFIEVKSRQLATDSDGRLWRSVPGRRWYANGSSNGAGREVVLLFRAR
jgi:DNA methylase